MAVSSLFHWYTPVVLLPVLLPGHSLRSLMCPHLLPPQNRLLRKDFRFRPGSGRCRYPVYRPGSVCRRCPVYRPGSAHRRCPVSRLGPVCCRYPVSRPGPESCPEFVSQQDCWPGRTRLFPKTMRQPETGLLLFFLIPFLTISDTTTMAALSI